MTPTTRRKLLARRSLTPLVDALEVRALMTASATTHAALIPAHVEVSNKSVHTESVDHAKAKTAVKSHAASKHVTKESVKAKTSTAKLSVKAILAMTMDLTVVKSGTQGLMPSKTGGILGGNVPVPGALTPVQVSGAYGVTALGLANQGQGQTIGIVDAYNDPNITADANTFSTQYGLQKFNVTGGPTFTVYKDSAIGPVANSPGEVDLETSLDVEWAHAMAPKANILLVEVPLLNTDTLDSYFGHLLTGIQYASSHGASVVSLSYGTTEENVGLPALYSLNQTYLSPGTAASQVAVTISAGDTSYPGFPASSPNVIGVGGTQLHVTTNNLYGSESAWGGVFDDGAAGGGETAFFKAPTFQTANGVNYGRYRTLPDVALLADPISSVSVYDSYDTNYNDGNPWTAVGGTSLASPLFAGMLSIVQEDRVAASKPILNSVQINNELYALYNSPSYLTYFHDITVGNNSDNLAGYAGYSTTTGYDPATGIGSPIANKLVPKLASL